jgi:hypothetical protein
MCSGEKNTYCSQNCASPAAYCTSQHRILYAWARNAPALQMPDGVAHSVGHENDGASYLVLQVHFATPFQGDYIDFVPTFSNQFYRRCL